ncbi:unnamed protein product, partial [Mesorhabditis belari]|uniref:LysM domain-containing protein n=1 Tax=Mesorhabditis belari TaxID=2138241 RepID=A0AAF3ECP3_9BILA
MDEQQIEIQMRSRVGRTGSTDLEKKGSYKDKILLERRLKPGDTLNKIALQYSLTVSELKRANNLVGDQEFVALSTVKIPVSRMRHALNLGVEGSADEELHEYTDRVPLIRAQSLRDSRDPSVEDIFHKTDNNIAQVRDALPEDGIPGSFHFVDARSPESGWSVWALLAAVVIVFMVVPLLLTLYEEEANEHLNPTAHASIESD